MCVKSASLSDALLLWCSLGHSLPLGRPHFLPRRALPACPNGPSSAVCNLAVS